MWKYLATLLVLLAIGGLGAAQDCADCYSNMITITNTQIIENVVLGFSSDIDTLAVGNELMSIAVIVTPPSVDSVDEDGINSQTGFARIDQTTTQTISGLGSIDLNKSAKGITWNKAMQAAWIVNQGQKELELDENGNQVWVKEGAYIAQTTNQTIRNVYDYADREGAKILNVDSKLAMIVDDLNRIVNLTADATTQTTDGKSSDGTVTDSLDTTISGTDT
jgi:hypothetical protein